MAPPPATKAPTTEPGSVATQVDLNGFPIDLGEHNPAFQWPNSVTTCELMRRNSQIRAVLSAVTLPLRRDIWALDPTDCRPEVVAACADNFDLPVQGQKRPQQKRRRGRFSFAEHNRLRLLSLVFGHMAFVQKAVFEGGLFRLAKLSPRFPSTIAKIDVEPDGGLKGIRQWQLRGSTGADNMVSIGVDQLLFYSIDREGAAWQGNSIFRSAFGDWILLERALRVRAMTNERNGMGVPIGEAPPGATQAQINEINEMAQRYGAGLGAGGALPHGAKLVLRGVVGTLPNLSEAISDHRAQIAKSVLTQFLELGTGDNAGHRALSEGFIDFFSASLDGYSSYFSDTLTQDGIEDFVDWNWGPDEPAPASVAKPVDAEKDIPVDALVKLLEVGAMEMSDTLEDFLRARYRLPPRRAEDMPRPLPAKTPPALAAGRRTEAGTDTTWTNRVRDTMGSLVDPAAIAAAIDAGSTPADAVVAGVVSDDDVEPLEETLLELWEEAYSEGTVGAEAKINAGRRPRRVVASLADLLSDGRGLALGILATLRKRLVAAIESLAEEGPLTASEVLDQVTEVANDADHAGLIAQTERQRAIVRGAMDTWTAAGVTRTRWVRLSGLSAEDLNDECAERHGTESDNWPSLPPVHPRCMCLLEPA